MFDEGFGTSTLGHFWHWLFKAQYLDPFITKLDPGTTTPNSKISWVKCQLPKIVTLLNLNVISCSIRKTSFDKYTQ